MKHLVRQEGLGTSKAAAINLAVRQRASIATLTFAVAAAGEAFHLKCHACLHECFVGENKRGLTVLDSHSEPADLEECLDSDTAAARANDDLTAAREAFPLHVPFIGHVVVDDDTRAAQPSRLRSVDG